MKPRSVLLEFTRVIEREPLDLVRAALAVARIEFPRLDPSPTLRRLSTLGKRAAARVAALGDAPVRSRLRVLSHLLYEEERFAGNRTQYGDFRNSLINVVVERRVGIPISLALVYMEVARRAGIEVLGVSFPGHFLLRVPDDAGFDASGAVILDPFDGGRELDLLECRRLLRRRVGATIRFGRALLAPCSRQQLLIRLLNNLKRTYVEQRSFPQARIVSDLLFAVDPSSGSELRDRGLLAYRLDDFAPALRDLEQYLRLQPWDDEDREERERVTEHVRNLRTRLAGLN